MSGARKGLVAPQNTFLDKIIRRYNTQGTSFVLSNARIVDYPIVYCNENFSKLVGFNRVEILQKSSTFKFLYGEHTTQGMKDQIQNALDNQAFDQFEIKLAKKNKSPLCLILYLAPVKNDKDEVVLFLLTFRDITSLKTTPDEEDANLSKFAKLARSVTKNKILSQTLMQNDGYLQNDSSTYLRVPTSEGICGSSLEPDSSQTGSLLFRGPELSRNDLEKGAFTWQDAVPQYKQEAPKTPPHIILHYVPFKSAWDWIILILTAYTAIMVPLNTSFRGKNSIDELLFLVIDSIVDVIFFIDIVLNFHTTFVGPKGEVISDANIIRLNYFKGWFIVDLLSCLPYDVFNAFQPETMHGTKISNLFSGLKVVRLLRIGRVTRKMDQYLEYMAASLILMIFGFVLLAHWLACIWYSTGYYDLENGLKYGWIYRLVNDTGNRQVNTTNIDEVITNTLGRKMLYITSLYYTLSLITSIGFGNVSANTFNEKLVSVLFMIIGAFGYATIFGKVTTIFQGMYATRSRYHDMMASVKDFVKTHTVPKDLAERVIDYVTSTWAITKGIDTSKVLNYCPKDMKADLCIHLNRMVFNEHSAFRLASDGCLRSLAVNFHTIHTAPGDLIFHQGESIDQLCFVASGSLEVIQDEEIVAILGKGDVFGEAFWKDPNRMSHSSATIRALTYCDLHCIKKDRVLQVLQFYSAFANSFARNLVLTYDLKSRLIFRKLSDVRREQELAEHRKNDNLLSEITIDHPVRKMINRFRRIGVTQSASVMSSSFEQEDNGSLTNIFTENSSDLHNENDKDPLRIKPTSIDLNKDRTSINLSRRPTLSKSSSVVNRPLAENQPTPKYVMEIISSLTNLKDQLIDEVEIVNKQLRNIEDRVTELTSKFYEHSSKQESYLQQVINVPLNDCLKGNRIKLNEASEASEVKGLNQNSNILISRILQKQRSKSVRKPSLRKSLNTISDFSSSTLTNSLMSNIEMLPTYSCQTGLSEDSKTRHLSSHSPTETSIDTKDLLSSNSPFEDDLPLSTTSQNENTFHMKNISIDDENES